MFEWIRFTLAAVLLGGGTLTACIAIYGVYRFHFVLNRMHAAAMIDTMAILMIIGALLLCSGFSFTSLKFLFVLTFLWFASPVSSHLISRLEVFTDEETVKKECEVEDR